MNTLRWFWVLALVTCAGRAWSQPTVLVEGPRVHLGDLVSSVPASVADADLGAAPPPGSSRLISRAECLRQLGRQGIPAGALRLPASVRVKSAARRIERPELAELVAAALGDALAPGVSLVRVDPTGPLVVSPRAHVARASVPRLPHRTGTLKTTALVEIETDGEVSARVAVGVVLELGPEAAQPDVARGNRLTLVIARRSAEITMSGIALADADVGDVVQFRVERTGKVLRGRIESRQSARVVWE